MKAIIVSTVLSLAAGVAFAQSPSEKVYQRIVVGDSSVQLDTSNRVDAPALGSYAAYLVYVGASPRAAVAQAAARGEMPAERIAAQPRTSGEDAYRNWVNG